MLLPALTSEARCGDADFRGQVLKGGRPPSSFSLSGERQPPRWEDTQAACGETPVGGSSPPTNKQHRCQPCVSAPGKLILQPQSGLRKAAALANLLTAESRASRKGSRARGQVQAGVESAKSVRETRGWTRRAGPLPARALRCHTEEARCSSENCGAGFPAASDLVRCARVHFSRESGDQVK